jgi:hypothetical protein
MKLHNAVYVFVASCSIAMAACQPSEGPVEQARNQVDKTAKKVGDQIDKTAGRAKQSFLEAKR